MPRTARIKSVSGYYHIVARGIARQVLFEDDEDHIFFLKMLKTYVSEGESSVIAFCLMDKPWLLRILRHLSLFVLSIF